MSADERTFDYVIAGGGLAGCVIASRLRQARPEVKIAIIEAGPNESKKDIILKPAQARALRQSDFFFHFQTAPQRHLDGRRLPNLGGKLLGGSSATNYAAWTRGPASDYDAWAKHVGDERWSYKELLPYFKRSEHYYEQTANPDQHGFDGAVKVSNGENRQYPLRDAIKETFLSSGEKFNPDINSGHVTGVSPLVESWHEGNRQHAAICYSLEGVEIITNSFVHKVIINDSKHATGVLLADGSSVHARKEVLVSCGALRTPQVLMLSGIGPEKELSKHGIKQIIDLPVGENLWDHPACNILWRLRHPDKGSAIGAPSFNKPYYFDGNPMDYMITTTMPQNELDKAIEADGGTASDPPRAADFEITCMYVVIPPSPLPPGPPDGTHITIGVTALSPTSRGTVTLASDHATDAPVIDPNYLATARDRSSMRAGVRLVLRLLASPAAQAIVVGETPPPGEPELDAESSDDAIDARVRTYCFNFNHAAGTAAMGTVVDTDCRVKGVEALRVVDASVLSLPISAHLQAPMYGVAERVAQMVIDAAA